MNTRYWSSAIIALTLGCSKSEQPSRAGRQLLPDTNRKVVAAPAMRADSDQTAMAQMDHSAKSSVGKTSMPEMRGMEHQSGAHAMGNVMKHDSGMSPSHMTHNKHMSKMGEMHDMPMSSTMHHMDNAAPAAAMTMHAPTAVDSATGRLKQLVTLLLRDSVVRRKAGGDSALLGRWAASRLVSDAHTGH